MSGGTESANLKELPIPEKVKEIMELFNVTEETARRILAWSTQLAQEKFQKWQRNYINRVMYRLYKKERERNENEDTKRG